MSISFKKLIGAEDPVKEETQHFQVESLNQAIPDSTISGEKRLINLQLPLPAATLFPLATPFTTNLFDWVSNVYLKKIRIAVIGINNPTDASNCGIRFIYDNDTLPRNIFPTSGALEAFSYYRLTDAHGWMEYDFEPMFYKTIGMPIQIVIFKAAAVQIMYSIQIEFYREVKQ